MKIDKIILSNLTSFEGEQVIDFTAEPLHSAGLFAICGDTGAGKSTLLDAICLALYDEAPRLDNAERLNKEMLSQDDSVVKNLQTYDTRNLLRRGKKEAYARVEFTMPDGARYEAGWSCRMKRTGNYDDVQRSFRQLAPKKTTFNGRNSEIQQKITEIIGLDYTQFSRTVMLAQNSFATFLQAKKSDKSSLLEKLTGTDIYGRISQKIHELHADAEKQVLELDSNIKGLLSYCLTPEELDELNNEIHQKTATHKFVGEKQKSIDEQLLWFNNYAQTKTQLEAAENHNMEAQKRVVEMRGEQLKLERYDSVQEVLPLFQKIEVRANDIEQLKAQDEEIMSQLSDCRTRLKQATSALDTSKEQTADAENEQMRWQPAINQGNKLSGEISEAENQVTKLLQQLKQAQDTLIDRQTRYREKLAVMEKTEEEIKEKELHQQTLNVHRVMFDKFELVKDKLASFRTESTQNAQDNNELKTKQSEHKNISDTLERLEKKQQEDQAQLNRLKSELLIHRQANQGHNGDELQLRLSQLRNRLQGLKPARELWKRIVTGYERIDERRAKIARDTGNLEQTRKDLERTKLEMTVRKEDVERKRESYMLSNSENIQRLRKSLKEGTACPVCGATHHPYHTETQRELGNLIENLSKDFDEAEELLKTSEQKFSELSNKLAADEAELKADKTYLAELEQSQAADETEWQNYTYLDPSFTDCSPTTNRSARFTLFGMLIDNAMKSCEESTKEMDTFNQHQNLINEITEKIEQFNTRIQNNENQVNTFRSDLKIKQSDIERLQQNLHRSDRVCSELYRDLDSMITLSSWLTEWQKNSDNFRLRLNNLFEDWNRTNNSLEDLNGKINILREEVKTMKDNETEANRQLVQARDEKDAALQRLNDKREEMRRLFGESSPSLEEERLKKYIAGMLQAQQKAQEAFDRTNNELNRLEGQHKNLEKTRLQKQEEYSDGMSQMDLWILKFNGTHAPIQMTELKQIFSDTRNWNELRTNLDARKKAATLAAHQVEQVRKALLQLQAESNRPANTDDNTRQQLIEQQQALIEQQVQLNEAIVGLRTRLQAHNNSIAQSQEKKEEFQQAKDNAAEWQRLDHLLGSADGKKFRELAQSYTFRFLVNHANVQLEKFCPRYRLQNMPGTLMLEIIDRDMFDQKRYVTSLSGGETFVVSLALALGLANLSSSGLNIGSLFIDEGFGNLDHESLELVMQALSSLEDSQGRKVGVISHTDQIRNQISPQIRVEKLPSSGQSHITIV